MSELTRCPGCGKKNRVPSVASGVPHCGSCQATLPWIVDASDADWSSVVEASRLPVLVDFWAEWCGPCRLVGPILEQLAVEYAGRVKLVKVDVDGSPAIAGRFQIQGIPTLAVVDGGDVFAQQVGAAGADQLRSWLDGALASVEGSRP